ncbi:MAG: hypothetical protein ACLR23_15785 [Clostridia bacterium]
MLTALLVVANLVVLFTKAGASSKRVNEVLGTELPGEESEVKCERQMNEPAVEFSHVSFRYTPEASLALEDITFAATIKGDFRHYQGALALARPV